VNRGDGAGEASKVHEATACEDSGVILAVWSNCGACHQSVTANEYCPSSSAVARARFLFRFNVRLRARCRHVEHGRRDRDGWHPCRGRSARRCANRLSREQQQSVIAKIEADPQRPDIIQDGAPRRLPVHPRCRNCMKRAPHRLLPRHIIGQIAMIIDHRRGAEIRRPPILDGRDRGFEHLTRREAVNSSVRRTRSTG